MNKKAIRRIKNTNQISTNFSEIEIKNLIGQYLKNCLYGFIYSSICLMYINNSHEEQICSKDGRHFTKFVQLGSIIIGFVYLSALARYKTLQNKDYVVLYLLNIAFFLVVMCYLIYSIYFHQRECNTLVVYQKVLLFVCLKKEFELAILMFTRSTLWIKQVNICTNAIFVFVLLSSENQTSCSPQAYTLNNFFNIINITAFVTYTLMNYLVNNLDKQIQVNVLKLTSMLIIPIFGYAFIRVAYFEYITEVGFSSDCIPTLFALDSYMYTVPIDITGMILTQLAFTKQQNNNDHFQIPENDSLLNVKNTNHEGFQQMIDLLESEDLDKNDDFHRVDIIKS